jgi:hypothetical protein
MKTRIVDGTPVGLMAHRVETASDGFPQIRSHLRTRSAACAPIQSHRRDPGSRQCVARKLLFRLRKGAVDDQRLSVDDANSRCGADRRQWLRRHEDARSPGFLHDKSVPAGDLLHQLWRRAVHLGFVRVHEQHVAHLSHSSRNGGLIHFELFEVRSASTRTTFQGQRIDSGRQAEYPSGPEDKSRRPR